jgi:DNA-binding GntR family transcriptional regulator
MCPSGRLPSWVKEEEVTDREKPSRKVRSLRDRAYTSIKNAIITAQLKPNQRLVEERMAADIGSSRTPVREALQKLEKEGLIFRPPRTGFVVKGVIEEEVEDILDLQRMLEGYAGRLATQRITEDEITHLNDLIKLQEECVTNADTEMFICLDGEFHDALHRAAKHARLYDLVQGLRDYLDRYRVIIFRSHANLDLSIKDHKEVVSLMKTKNARQIEKLMGKHMIRGKNIIKNKIRRDGQDR